MGTPFKSFLRQDAEAFEFLAEWADLDPRQMQEMLSWTGVWAGNVRMTFRGEVFVSRALRNPVMRGCPACLRKDVARHDGPGTAAMILRGDWQMREVNICVRHGQPLVPLWRSEAPRERFDIGSRLHEIEEDILSGVFDQPETRRSACDLWLDGRLRDGRDATWFEGQPLFAATTFCRVLGQTVLADDCAEDPATVGAAHAAGFDIARHGEVAVRRALDRVAKASTDHPGEPNKAFGPLYQSLGYDHADEDGFLVFADILRDCILANWPIAAGDTVLGEIVRERRLHSLATAARETGIGPQVIEQFLIEAGALREDDDRPDSRRVFDARQYEDLLSEIPTLVGPLAMRRAMGATARELKGLESEGLLVPRTRVAKVKNPWRLADGAAFVADLAGRAAPVTEDADDWETLLHARKRTKLSLSDQVAAIREQRLALWSLPGGSGFNWLVVRKTDIDHLSSPHPRRRRYDAVALPGLLSAAEFGRSIGLRDGGNFVSLIEAGHTPGERHLNPRTGRQQYWLGEGDIAAFHRRFVTLATLSEETGRHRNTVKSFLERAQVTRFAPDGQDFGPVFLRTAVLKMLR